jgi:hypothetical protein
MIGPAREAALPEISRFFGIVVAVFYNDHPPAAFSRPLW